ncbi:MULTISPECIES: isoaspartyl peptidase/L-asparaginase [Halobacterium]|uniref:Plant-type L-asparaginase n=10 Tax=Halobacterium salinarum TaxID=2242 RepID=Q9HNZ8_HALSA|nr:MULTISPECIES: isoaspartyl peptidase/L-asparaginase [Halobacterium]AAG20072.1 conserved hypothetical protein [Halobacterium salinarum NRC-1]MBB6089082.1 L-asparaginase/beta-aspartyl-peptidase (threonine type) [Halobacterium salinarum]MCF2166141.1 isoaspartyl peptidase/L-asparaginase [Halobacterium salinarum]MCF2167624.1 isoaspartyl peptidase/L-asparaginase [Halobacterium salinarum]MCF2237585.1 isoaspartyl peptidase/L-asparaginase [Halobacterium salinarum]
MRVLVHGGAGAPPDAPAPRQDTLETAADTGASHATPVDAVTAAVRVLERDPAFNAGTGATPQSDGVIRTDAGMMTSDRAAGAAASMPGVEAAVAVARAVMADTPHVLLSGVHAVDFAADTGIPVESDLWTADTRARWDDLDSHPDGSPTDHRDWVRERFGRTDPGGRESPPGDHDTVGAVASDGDRFATATSTGGRWLALAGRVGDVPQIGAGFYAAPAGAASATGAGEAIAKTTLSRRAVRHLEAGLGAQAAADRAIEEFSELTGASAGVIVVDRDGGCGTAHNAAAMQTARH